MAYEMLEAFFMEAGPAVLTELLTALIILLAGIIAGKIVGLLVKKLLIAMKLREGIENLGAESTFLGIDLIELTRIFAEWYTYMYFLLTALNVLAVPALATFIDEIKALSVLIIEAILITYIGLQISNYVRKNLELYSKYPLLGAIVYYFLVYLTSILALSVLFPQAAQLLNWLLLVVVASAGLGVGLGAAIAIGLGTKDLVAKTVSGYKVKAPRARKPKRKKTK